MRQCTGLWKSTNKGKLVRQKGEKQANILDKTISTEGNCSRRHRELSTMEKP